MDEIISLRFKYTEEEYVSASRLYQMRAQKLLLRIGAVSVIVAVFILSVLIMNLGFEASLALILAAFVPFLSLFLSLSILPRRRFRADPRFKDEYLLQFSDDGIHFKTAQIDALIQWSLYSKVIENDRFYLLVQGQNMISVIPKRAFTSAIQREAFDELLRRKFPQFFGTKRLKESEAVQTEKPYVPPAQPPDWR